MDTLTFGSPVAMAFNAAGTAGYASDLANGQLLILAIDDGLATVDFDPNGGAGAMAAQTAPRGTPAALTPNAFTRDQYSFAGWNTAADGSGTPYADQASFDFAADITLYAQWQAIAVPPAPTEPGAPETAGPSPSPDGGEDQLAATGAASPVGRALAAGLITLAGATLIAAAALRRRG